MFIDAFTKFLSDAALVFMIIFAIILVAEVIRYLRLKTFVGQVVAEDAMIEESFCLIVATIIYLLAR